MTTQPTTTDAAIAQSFIAIIGSAWMNDSGSGLSYDWDGDIFPTRDEAIQRGFQLRESDDFNVGVIQNGKLVSLDWMTEPVDTDPKELAEIAQAIGFMSAAELSTATPATAHGGGQPVFGWWREDGFVLDEYFGKGDMLTQGYKPLVLQCADCAYNPGLCDTHDAKVVPPAGGFVVDLSRVLALSEEGASCGPMQWLAKPDMTPDEMKAWIAESVDITVSDDAFTGTLHSIAEQDTGRIVAYTGCGPKSGPNAQFLIAAAHFIIQHGPSLASPTAQPSAKDGERRHDFSDDNGRRCIVCGTSDWETGGVCPGAKDEVRGCACKFDEWQENPYTKVLMKSVNEDYVPKGEATTAAGLVDAARAYMAAVDNLNAALNDGRNVHGALSGLIGTRDLLEAAIGREVGK